MTYELISSLICRFLTRHKTIVTVYWLLLQRSFRPGRWWCAKWRLSTTHWTCSTWMSPKSVLLQSVGFQSEICQAWERLLKMEGYVLTAYLWLHYIQVCADCLFVVALYTGVCWLLFCGCSIYRCVLTACLWLQYIQVCADCLFVVAVYTGVCWLLVCGCSIYRCMLTACLWLQYIQVCADCLFVVAVHTGVCWLLVCGWSIYRCVLTACLLLQYIRCVLTACLWLQYIQVCADCLFVDVLWRINRR